MDSSPLLLTSVSQPILTLMTTCSIDVEPQDMWLLKLPPSPRDKRSTLNVTSSHLALFFTSCLQDVLFSREEKLTRSMRTTERWSSTCPHQFTTTSIVKLWICSEECSRLTPWIESKPVRFSSTHLSQDMRWTSNLRSIHYLQQPLSLLKELIFLRQSVLSDLF